FAARATLEAKHGTSRPRRPPSRDRLHRSRRCKRRLGSAGIGDRLPCTACISHLWHEMGTAVRSRKQQFPFRTAQYRSARALGADASSAKATVRRPRSKARPRLESYIGATFPGPAGEGGNGTSLSTGLALK